MRKDVSRGRGRRRERAEHTARAGADKMGHRTSCSRCGGRGRRGILQGERDSANSPGKAVTAPSLRDRKEGTGPP